MCQACGILWLKLVHPKRGQWLRLVYHYSPIARPGVCWINANKPPTLKYLRPAGELRTFSAWVDHSDLGPEALHCCEQRCLALAVPAYGSQACVSSQLHVQGCHTGSLKSTTVGIFTPWKWVKAINHGFSRFSLFCLGGSHIKYISAHQPAFPTSSPIILLMRWFFTHEETEAQRIEGTCPREHSQKVTGPEFKPTSDLSPSPWSWDCTVTWRDPFSDL